MYCVRSRSVSTLIALVDNTLCPVCLCDTESGAHQLVMPQLITTHTLQFAVNYNIDKTEGNVKEKENTSFRFDVGWGTNFFISVYISREN